MSASAGRVLIKPKGAYNPLTTYAVMDYVTYTDGNGYLCIEPTTGHAPTDTTYWQLFVDNTGTVHTTDIANNLTTQTAGKVLDASQGYALNNSLAQQVLCYTSVACSATTGNFATVSNAAITADHVVAECTFANPSAITSDVTWTTSAGSVVLNGTCASATTANIVLVKKGN